MTFRTRTLTGHRLYVGYLALLGVAEVAIFVAFAVSWTTTHHAHAARSTPASAPAQSAGVHHPGSASPGPAAGTDTSTTVTAAASTTTSPPTTARSTTTTTSGPAVGTVYLPVHPGSGAGCTAGITEGNRWIKYVVQRGDNLSEIARCFDLNGYQELYQDNIHVIGSNPNLIYAGQVFTIVNGVMTET